MLLMGSLRRRLDERWAGGSSNPRSWVVLLSSVTGGSGAPMASVLVEPLSPQVNLGTAKGLGRRERWLVSGQEPQWPLKIGNKLHTAQAGVHGYAGYGP